VNSYEVTHSIYLHLQLPLSHHVHSVTPISLTGNRTWNVAVISATWQ